MLIDSSSSSSLNLQSVAMTERDKSRYTEGERKYRRESETDEESRRIKTTFCPTPPARARAALCPGLCASGGGPGHDGCLPSPEPRRDLYRFPALEIIAPLVDFLRPSNICCF
ncbi:hypothetical protein EVAR_28051_1 [Eumeta japonica]|uniref:Uncharacterized protein n=1 Tax=Eumeta variegata TaxID=151549 RepID=A0A4C1W7F4_EUMVA|nr:hypothetical protein EVAR_28051_1 [Eumeta japonica]